MTAPLRPLDRIDDIRDLLSAPHRRRPRAARCELASVRLVVDGRPVIVYSDEPLDPWDIPGQVRDARIAYARAARLGAGR